MLCIYSSTKKMEFFQSSEMKFPKSGFKQLSGVG